MMKKYVFRKFQCPGYIADALEYLRPPERVMVSEWSERHRVLDAKSAAMPGPWRNSVTPYLAEIMDTQNDYEIETTVFVKPTQVGGTECLMNRLGCVIAQDPGPAMVVYPTDTLGKSTSENRLEPMILSSPELAKRYNKAGSKDLELQFEGMYVTISGANSPSSLASKPIRYLFLDEVDKFPAASKREADPISLAMERTKTFVSNRKIYMCSTPTLRSGHIWRAKESADVEKHYFIPCPHCGQMIELRFGQIKWPKEEDGVTVAERAEQAVYVCQECGAIISDAEKNLALRCGRWRAVRGLSGKSVAYWLNTLYSPFVRFSEIAREFMNSKDDPDKLHNFINSWLAEPWEETKTKTSPETVLERQTELEAGTLPDWTKLVTAGVDVQENCLYWTIRAWGDHITSQNVLHGQAWSYSEVEQLMNAEYKKADGTAMMVELALVDSGDQTDAVYDFCARNSEWALPCKGVGNQLSHYRLSHVNKVDSRACGMPLALVDGGKYKDMIASRMRKENGVGSWMVHAACDDEYVKQITSEQPVIERNKKGQEVRIWKQKTDRAPNHYLDCEVYCMAAADIKGVRSLFLETEQEPEAAAQPNRSEQYAPEESWIRQNENWI